MAGGNNANLASGNNEFDVESCSKSRFVDIRMGTASRGILVAREVRSMLPLKGYTENILSHTHPALTIISFILPHPSTINHTLSSDNIKLEAGKSGSLYDLHHVNSKILQVVPLPLVPHS